MFFATNNSKVSGLQNRVHFIYTDENKFCILSINSLDNLETRRSYLYRDSIY